MNRTGVVLLSLLLALPLAARADESASEGRTWHRLVGILQYLQADYPAAVESQSEFELTEQKSFIAEAVVAANELGSAGQGFLPRIQAVKARVDEGKDPEGVSRDCGALVEDLVLAGGLSRSPRQPPNLTRGEELYKVSCTACHGADGRAQVTIAQTMEPQPANFHDPDIMAGLTPYKAFNTTSFGVPGTAMPGFPTLSEDERWSLAFFLFTLRQPACEGTPPRVSLERLATATDPELAAEYGEQNIACLRRKLPDVDEERALMAARTRVEEALRLGGSGDMLGARNALLDAYLTGLEPVEVKLRARDPQLVTKLEQSFLQSRLAAERNSPHLQDEGRELLSLLDQARRGSGNTASMLSVIWLTFLILLREGFEATVIVAALLAALKKMEATQQVRVVHAGWISALVVGALAFFFGRHLLAGANREVMEGVVALVAVAMLLYAALWLNARANMSRFMGELRQKMQGALGSGSTLGLFAIAFTAVLRESFETAVFLQGLALDSASGVAWGSLAGGVALVAMVLFVRRVGYKLPMKTLFQASTVLLVATAVMLLGKGLHALQEVALLPLMPIPFVTVEMLGVYPDAVSLTPQLVLALAPLAFLAFRKGRTARLAGASSQG
ncbi:cytochrome c/FTR1 family iron permease [Hyalangium rubrum]|uniref:Cytochrome c/FTR1 family iron permease n=1 Tax=Hyalangium rubrum TaxID=3103134 RepID=A0ABU5HGK5_9BACT|nr:cytochrome c/FTR1 family iron permease [Hyalangium sp. s54d21]MDY7231973.1 cytochrome c/FTR1 family iron permease [Hyalangium sp. s54d21]